MQAAAIDNLPGNAGKPGRWIMRIENSNGEEDSDLKCISWASKDDESRSSNLDRPDPCPCTVDQAELDDRYVWIKPTHPYTECFYTVFPSRDKMGQRCCYYKDFERQGALITGFPKGGTIDRYHQLQYPEDHSEHDVPGFQFCCLRARNFRVSCQKYYARRPSEDCEAYVPPAQGGIYLCLELKLFTLYPYLCT